MKRILKIFIFLILPTLYSPYTFFVKGQLLLNFCDASEITKTEREDIRKEIQKLIEKFSKEGVTEREKYDIERKIEDEFGLKALPYLLQSLKEGNKEMQNHCLSTILEIIGREKRSLEISRTNLTPEEIEKTKIDIMEFPLPQEERENIEKAFLTISEFATHPNSEIRAKAIDALGCFGSQKAVPLLEKALNDVDASVRYVACIRLSILGHHQYNLFNVITGKEPKTPEEYAEYLSDEKWGLYIKAEDKLKEFGKESIPVLLKLAKGDKEPARQRALRLLVEMKAEEAIPILTNYLKEETTNKIMSSVQFTCVSGLYNIGTEEAIKQLKEYGLKHKNPDIRYYTAKTLIKTNKEEVMPVLKDLVEQGNSSMKYDIALFLIENKEKEGIEILIGLLKDKKYLREAESWLEDATGQKFGEIPPVVSKKMLEEYTKKWESWWEKNKDTFQFPKQDKQ